MKNPYPRFGLRILQEWQIWRDCENTAAQLVAVGGIFKGESDMIFSPEFESGLITRKKYVARIVVAPIRELYSRLYHG